jgi:acetyl esterase
MYSDGYLLTAADMDWFWANYLEDPGQAYLPYVSPLLAESLSGLPQSLILVAEFDLLRDQGIRYAQRLRAAGVRVEVQTCVGQIHGFLGFAGVIDEAHRVLARAGRAVRGALTK